MATTLALELICLLGLVASMDVKRLAVPHDVYPGYGITRLEPKGQYFVLEDGDYSPYFALLSDGLLMATTGISHLANTPVTLLVKEEYPNSTNEQVLIIHVVERTKMLKFDRDVYQGVVTENQPPGTPVEDIERIMTFGDPSHKITYSLVSGNDEEHFAITESPANDSSITLATKVVLDREAQGSYELVIRAVDVVAADTSEAIVRIEVLDVNDNSPIPDSKSYRFKIPHDTELYSVIGNVTATDGDGDHPVYHFTTRHPVFAIVPKTGQILLISSPLLKTYKLTVRADDGRKPPRYSPAIPVYVEVFYNDFDSEIVSTNYVHVRPKRSVRATKSYEYKETDGSVTGRVMFQLDKKSAHEAYKIENPNRWVDVELSGEVKVKEPWDYEQLGKEKTIDFWVFVTGPKVEDAESATLEGTIGLSTCCLLSTLIVANFCYICSL